MYGVAGRASLKCLPEVGRQTAVGYQNTAAGHHTTTGYQTVPTSVVPISRPTQFVRTRNPTTTACRYFAGTRAPPVTPFLHPMHVATPTTHRAALRWSCSCHQGWGAADNSTDNQPICLDVLSA